MDPYAPSGPAALAAELAGCRAAHDRLIADLAGLTDDDAQAPSALPDWTVGHVLSHLARNAEAISGMVAGVAAGEVRAMYPNAEARAAGIDAGAGLPAADLVAGVRDSAEALHAAWDALTPEMWATGGARTRVGVVPASYLPMMRWREVEIHHADLGRGFGWTDWSPEYVRADLPRLVALLVDGAPDDARRLAAALAGRHDGPVSLGSVLA